MAATNSKKLVATILQYVESEMKKTGNADNRKDLENALTSLQSAYKITSTEVPNNQKSLEELFLIASTKTVSNKFSKTLKIISKKLPLFNKLLPNIKLIFLKV